MKFLTGLITSIVLAGCMEKGVPVTDNSSVKDIIIVLPELSVFSADPVLQAKLSGYALSITSDKAECNKEKPVLNKLASLTIADKIQIECDYKIGLQLGFLAADNSKLDGVYYVGEASLSQADIATQIANGGSKVGVDVLLDATEEGAKLGFNGQVKTLAVDLAINVKVKE